MAIIEGIITKVLREDTGVNKQGKPWKKGNYVLTSLDKHAVETKFDVLGEDRIKELNLQVGQKVKLEGSVESREFNDKWYSDVHVYRFADQPTEAKKLF
jgi:hypothetical protein